MRCSVILFALVLFMHPTPSSATTRVVNADGSGDYPTIQSAIDMSVGGDIIELTNGTFSGDGNRDLDFGGIDLTVRSQSADPTLCVIDCEGSLEEPHRGFDFQNGETIASVIEGITITNGYGYNASHGSDGGGAVRCNASSPRLVDCIVSNCQSVSNATPLGGGINLRNDAHITLDRCTFSACVSHAASGNHGYGGGIGAWNGTVDATDCLFIDNSAPSGGGGVRLLGPNPSSFVRCRFDENQAGRGGGLRANGEGLVTLDQCTFTDNVASGFGEDSWGGGVELSPAIVTQCTFAYNSSEGSGGNVWILGEQDMRNTITNTIIAYSMNGEGIAGYIGASAALSCCDVYGNADGDYDGVHIQDQTGMNGNISEPPLFCDESSDDYTIDAQSPCAPDNNDCLTLMGSQRVGCGTPIETTSWSRLKDAYRP